MKKSTGSVYKISNGEPKLIKQIGIAGTADEIHKIQKEKENGLATGTSITWTELADF